MILEVERVAGDVERKHRLDAHKVGVVNRHRARVAIVNRTATNVLTGRIASMMLMIGIPSQSSFLLHNTTTNWNLCGELLISRVNKTIVFYLTHLKEFNAFNVCCCVVDIDRMSTKW
jgi:hypothetical protein